MWSHTVFSCNSCCCDGRLFTARRHTRVIRVRIICVPSHQHTVEYDENASSTSIIIVIIVFSTGNLNTSTCKYHQRRSSSNFYQHFSQIKKTEEKKSHCIS